MAFPRAAADAQVGLACELATHLPGTLAAMGCGEVDVSRARVLVEELVRLAVDGQPVDCPPPAVPRGSGVAASACAPVGRPTGSGSWDAVLPADATALAETTLDALARAIELTPGQAAAQVDIGARA